MRSSSTASLTDRAVQAAMAAADVIATIYRQPIQVALKSDGSPVTEADQAAERVIFQHLGDTGLPILGEESVSAGIIPQLGDRYFVVDPLDGTREFIKRNGEFTVNIGLVEHGRPVLGVVLAPTTGALFVGDGEGAWSATVINGVLTEKKPINVSPSGPLRVVASRSYGHAALARFCEAFDVESDISVGSSLKFCLLARGDAQLYPRFTPTCHWDTAAGQAVLEAAGGAMVNLDGSPMRYGKHEQGFLNSFFAAAASMDLAQRAAAEMRSLLS